MRFMLVLDTYKEFMLLVEEKWLEMNTHEISKDDLDSFKENMFKLVTIPGEEVIHVIPQEYTVDGEDFIQDPKGMGGKDRSRIFT